MFGGGEPGGGFYRVREARNAQEDGFGSDFSAKAGCGVHAGFPQSAGLAENAGEGADFGLLADRQFCEYGTFLPRFGAAVIADRGQQDGPVLR